MALIPARSTRYFFGQAGTKIIIYSKGSFAFSHGDMSFEDFQQKNTSNLVLKYLGKFYNTTLIFPRTISGYCKVENFDFPAFYTISPSNFQNTIADIDYNRKVVSATLSPLANVAISAKNILDGLIVSSYAAGALAVLVLPTADDLFATNFFVNVGDTNSCTVVNLSAAANVVFNENTRHTIKDVQFFLQKFSTIQNSSFISTTLYTRFDGFNSSNQPLFTSFFG